MSFAVSLSSDTLSVDPGSTQPLSIGVTNHGSEKDHFEIQVEGLDPAWTTLPVDSFVIEPGETQVQKALLRPPRDSESAAGSYPFVVTVRSLNTGNSHSAEAVLEVSPFHQLSMNAEPKRVVLGGLKPAAEFDVTVINLGNTEHELQLFASDPENEVAFEFEHEKVKVGPGQQRNVVVRASTRRSALLANGKLYGVGFSTRSTANPTVAAYAQAQIELRPVIALAPFFTVLGLVALSFAWFATIPKPPKIDLFRPDHTELKVGQSVILNYQVSDASTITLFINNELYKTTSEGAGNITFSPKDPGQYTLRLEAKRNDKLTSKVVQLNVAPPDEIPKPEIERFKVSQTSLVEGEPLTVTFAVNSATTKVEIRPIGLFPAKDQTTATFKPNWMGAADVVIMATNSTGETVTKSISVTVKPLVPEIAAFAISPNKAIGPDAKVTVRWTLKNCSRAELEFDGQVIPVNATSGSYELTVNKSGPVSVRGWDSKGKPVTKSSMIEWLPEAPSEDPASPGGSTPVTPPSGNGQIEGPSTNT